MRDHVEGIAEIAADHLAVASGNAAGAYCFDRSSCWRFASHVLRRGDERVWSGVTDDSRSLPERQSATLALIVAEAVRRKNARHADDVRIVREWQLTIRSDGTATLRAEASALLAVPPTKPRRRHG